VEAVRNEGLAGKIILMSGTPEMVTGGTAAQCDSVVGKPFEVKELLALVKGFE